MPGVLAAIELSAEEQAWVAAHTVIRARIGDRPPFAMMRNGQAQGMAVDYLRLVCERLGIEPEFTQITGDKESIHRPPIAPLHGAVRSRNRRSRLRGAQTHRHRSDGARRIQAAIRTESRKDWQS